MSSSDTLRNSSVNDVPYINNHTRSDAASFDTFFQEQTSNLRKESWPDITKKVRAVINFLQQERINVVLFLDAFSWGNSECIADPVIKQARAQLMTSKELPDILQRWLKPPRNQNSHSAHAEAARYPIEKISLDCINSMLCNEMKGAKDFLASSETRFSAAELLQIRIGDIISRMKEKMPTLWYLLSSAVTRKENNTKEEHDGKNHDRVSIPKLCILNVFSYLI